MRPHTCGSSPITCRTRRTCRGAGPNPQRTSLRASEQTRASEAARVNDSLQMAASTVANPAAGPSAAQSTAANSVNSPTARRRADAASGKVESTPAVRRLLSLLRGLFSFGRSLTLILAILSLGHFARADEPSGLALAVSIEASLVDAIATGEKSLVAIARVRHVDRDELGAIEVRPDPLGRLQLGGGTPRPGEQDFIPNEYGAGVVVDKRGLILTNYHVLGEDSDFFVTTADRRTYPARVVAADPRSDLAVLSIEAHDLVPMKFGDGAAVKKGQIVIALGNPYAIARDGQVSASWGIISNISRKAGPTPDENSTSAKPTLHHFGTLLQTDAKLNLGTSGGALLNLKGEMIGLTTSRAATVGYEQAAGFAIPVDETFRRIVDVLKQGREVEYGFLGVRPVNLSEPEILSGRQGMRVAQVVEGTPAYRGGLLPDDIITHVDGQAVFDADGLMLHVGKMPAEATVRLTVERDGRLTPVHVSLSKLFVRGKKVITSPVPYWRGLRVEYPTATEDFQVRANRREIDLDGCVVISDVEADSPAWKEGLRPNMVISHVGGTRVSTPREFQSAVSGKNGAVPLRQIIADDNRPVRSVVRNIPATAG